MLRTLREQEPAALRDLTFTILEIGALPIEGEDVPFHHLVDIFPGSRIVAFEVDENLCAELNDRARPGFQFHAAALGRTEERRRFYQTADPMCSSLYPPNEELLARYFNMESAILKNVT
ncbi:MAG: hypothetical protein ACE5G3_13390, partial [Gammaproteobacteria bacterium]